MARKWRDELGDVEYERLLAEGGRLPPNTTRQLWAIIFDMHRTRSEANRARVVLLAGEPGSGKTTLGLALSRELRFPFLSRDDVRGGLFFTEGAWSEHPRRVPTADEAVEAMLRIAETTAGLGVSCVVEYVFRQERPADLARIEAVAESVVIRTWCADALARCADRDASDRLLNRQPVLDVLGYDTVLDRATSAWARMRSVASEMQTDFDLPTLSVNTDDGYTPSLEHIIGFITNTDPPPYDAGDFSSNGRSI